MKRTLAIILILLMAEGLLYLAFGLPLQRQHADQDACCETGFNALLDACVPPQLDAASVDRMEYQIATSAKGSVTDRAVIDEVCRLYAGTVGAEPLLVDYGENFVGISGGGLELRLYSGEDLVADLDFNATILEDFGPFRAVPEVCYTWLPWNLTPDPPEMGQLFYQQYHTSMSLTLDARSGVCAAWACDWYYLKDLCLQAASDENARGIRRAHRTFPRPPAAEAAGAFCASVTFPKKQISPLLPDGFSAEIQKKHGRRFDKCGRKDYNVPKW